jgi:hypothetical protein
MNDKMRSSLSRATIPMNTTQQHEPIPHDKHLATSIKLRKQSTESAHLSRETKESGWVQINNVFVPYIVKLKLRDSDLGKCQQHRIIEQLNILSIFVFFWIIHHSLARCSIN